MSSLTDLENSTPASFSVSLDFESVDMAWTFARHHLIYAASGLVHIETDEASWRLPPSRAAWLHAGTQGRTISHGAVHGVSIFFGIDFPAERPFQCRVFNISPLVREMIMYGLRWGQDRALADPVADRFFLTLADLCQELCAHPELLYLPKAQSLELQQVLDYMAENLEQQLQFSVCAQQANLSERTLARRFSNEIHMTFRQFLNRARMIRAMELLADGNSVTRTALDVGFSNVGAFSTAFQNFSRLTPTQYQNNSSSKKWQFHRNSLHMDKSSV